VCVDGQPRKVKRDAADNICCLAADAWELHEILKRRGNVAAELRQQELSHADQVLRLALIEAGGLHKGFDFDQRGTCQGLGVWKLRKQSGRHHVDPRVGALRRQDCRSEQLEGIAVIEFADRLRIENDEVFGDDARPTLWCSRKTHDSTLPLRQYPETVRFLDIKQELNAAEIAGVQRLLAAAERADGHRPLSDHLWLDLVHGGRPGFTGLIASEPGHDHLVAYAQLSRGNDSWALEVVVDPHHRYEMHIIGPELIEAAVGVIAEAGGGHVHWWVFEPTQMHATVAASGGLQPGRRLHQMCRPLPTGIECELDTRDFVVGQDEAAWLEVNNRAFAWHPEQGGWDLETLQAREQQPWFDPAGFRLHERDGRLAGFCWTKVHRDNDPVLGEIYVIAVDPDFHGLGLGKALTLAGLDHLARQGVGTGMLYVDADNATAVAMYERLGFSVHRTDRAFVGDVAGSPS
jgi:mycothiol synthase